MEGYYILVFLPKILATLSSCNALDAKPPACPPKIQEFLFHFPWFSPHGVLPWDSRAYESGYPWNFQGQHMADRSLPTAFPISKAPSSLYITATDPRQPQEKMKNCVKRKSWSRIQMKWSLT